MLTPQMGVNVRVSTPVHVEFVARRPTRASPLARRNLSASLTPLGLLEIRQVVEGSKRPPEACPLCGSGDDEGGCQRACLLTLRLQELNRRLR